MTALTSPKGPLPTRVYWLRRLMVFSLLFVLVFGTTRLFGGDSGDDTPAAAVVSAEQKNSREGKEKDADQKDVGSKDAGRKDAGRKDDDQPRAGTPRPSGDPSASAAPTPSATPTPTETPKPQPQGECVASDVVVKPVPPSVRTTLKITFGLMISTKTSEACTWTVSPKTVVLKVDSGPRSKPDVVWQSRQCTDAIPTQDVVLYRDEETVVPVTWSGRRSDSECSRNTSWARRGWYHVQAAAFGGEPTDVQFELTRLSPVTVTRTVKPKVQPSKKERASASASAKPDGAVEPDQVSSDR